MVLAAPLTACAEEERDLAVGDSARVLDDPDVTRLAQDPDLTALLPVGELGLGWSEDPDLLGSVTDDEGSALAAADGATLVAVSWDLDATRIGVQGGPGFAVVEGGSDHELALVSGGERTVLESDDGALRGSAVAAVADVADVALEVTFDGVTQTVGPVADDREVPAEARPLYDGVPQAEAVLDCVPAAADVFCRADAAWLPWVSGQGWAPQGQLWPVVAVEARPAVGATLDASLDSASPVAVEDLQGGDGVQQLLVFAAASPASASLEIELTGGDVALTGAATLSPRTPTGR